MQESDNGNRSTTGGIHSLSCPHCHKTHAGLQDGIRFCQFCGGALDHSTSSEAPFPEPEPKFRNCGGPRLRPSQNSRQNSSQNSRLGPTGRPLAVNLEPSREGRVAAALSIVPGLGQVYNGEFFKGLAFCGSSLLLAPAGIGIIIWAYAAVHAHRGGARREATSNFDIHHRGAPDAHFV